MYSHIIGNALGHGQAHVPGKTPPSKQQKNIRRALKRKQKAKK